MTDQQKKQTWYIIFFAIIFLLVARTFPRAAFGLAAIVLLIWLLKFTRK